MAKRYYWLKLQDSFFIQKSIKKLRKMAGGDTFVIIYLKLQLLSLKNDGKLYYDGLEDNLADELALELDEDCDNVKFTLLFLEKCGLVEPLTTNEYILPEAVGNMGSETDAAERVRQHRAKKVALQCNATVTNRNTEKTTTEQRQETEQTTTDSNAVVELTKFGLTVVAINEMLNIADTQTVTDLIKYAKQYKLGAGWLRDAVRNPEKRPPSPPKPGSEAAAVAASTEKPSATEAATRAREREAFELAQLSEASEIAATAEIKDNDFKNFLSKLTAKCSLPVNS